ncbi:MAG: ABC transporter ATP-binding protein [Ignavibacteriales bacterium]
MALIDVSNAFFSYGQQDIFRGLNLTINEGEIFCLLGPNGCGKTTLLDCILGLRKLKTGGVSIGGIDISYMRPGEAAKQVAYVPQSHDKTFPYSVRQIVLMGRAAHLGLFGLPSKKDEEIADEALEMVGIAALKYRRYTELSGGESQMVMIARALAQQTRIIIMDEPTAHLDFRHELDVLETIAGLARDSGKSILMATHFPNHAFFFENNGVTSHVAMMARDYRFLVGESKDILNEKNLSELYNINARLVSCSLDEGQEIKHIIPISTLPSNN